jgi:hydrogenase expression/formation protein HypC
MTSKRQVDMCLGIPGKIIEIYERNDIQMGKIDFGGVIKEICLVYIPEAEIGDYALVHVGFAISLLEEDEAIETLKLIKEVVDFNAELGEQ